MRLGHVLLALAVTACAGQPTVPSEAPVAATLESSATAAAPTEPAAIVRADAIPSVRQRGVIARSDRFIIYAAVEGDTLESIARRFLGSARRAWELADFNASANVEPGRVVAIPLTPPNPMGIHGNGYQTVPILCYHRFGPKSTSRMVVSTENFERQLALLVREGYRVIRLAELSDFLDGKRALPQRAVVITVDDGHISAYQYALPLLRKYGFPATLFMYTDLIGAREGLSWPQIREMADSGLIDFQAHSRTHTNLTLRRPDETDQRYIERLDAELRTPRAILQKNLPGPIAHYAYPYGDANELVLDRMTLAQYRLGLTVTPGGNAFFAHPLMLRRTMVFGEHSIEQFRGLLHVFREITLR